MFATELTVFFVCFDWFSFLILFFLFLSVHHHCNLFFLKERLVIHPSSHPFIHFSTYLPFHLIYLQDMRKMGLLLWYAEKRFTDRDIFSSKITFLCDPCVFIFRIFNKLDNITWKSVLSPTSSPFSCSWGWGGFFLVSLLQCYLTWLESRDLPW